MAPLISHIVANEHLILSGERAVFWEREKTLMGLYYEQKITFKEIAAFLGVSEPRICQIHSQAIARLRSVLKEVAWTSIA